jgi:SNF2 family DNA or RNA helicase
MWHDQTRNVLIYENPDPRLLDYAVGAVRVNGHLVAMPITFQNLQIARVFNLPVIRPLKDYDYPRGPHIKQPFHAQTETANFLSVNPRAFVLSDMGTGKTLSALWAADALMADEERHGRRLRAVVVAPLSTLQTVWADAIFANFLGRRKAVILHGTPEKRLLALQEPADFYLINHDGLKLGARRNKKTRRIELGGLSAAINEHPELRLIIFDEAGAYRANNTVRSVAARLISSKRELVWAMTGTPTPNGPLDAYGIAKLLNNAKGESFTSFKSRIMQPVPGSRFKWVPKRGANEEAMRLMQPAIRFSLEECTDMPELVYIDLLADLSADQARMMKDMRHQFILELKKGVVTGVNEAAVRTKLLQIAAGAVYDNDHVAHRIDCGPRLAALRELIDESAGKVIVFAPFTSVVDMLTESLTEYSRERIYGATPNPERAEIIRRFQKERDPRVLIAHPETIAEGQNLAAAATVAWWAPIDKTRLYLQGNRRIYRPEQTRNCTVVNVCGSKIEREVYRRLANNEDMQGVLLKMAKEEWI